MDRKKTGLLFCTDSLHLKHKVIMCFNFDPHGAASFQSTAGGMNIIGTFWKVKCIYEYSNSKSLFVVENGFFFENFGFIM